MRKRQSNRTLSNRRAAKGVALITVLLVVVIATVLGVSMTTDQHFAINRTSTLMDGSRVRQYALGGEELARQILHQDFVDAPTIDHLGENWAATNLRFEFEDGAIEIKIDDLQGRFNLNSLQAVGAAKATAKTRFQALLSQQGLDLALVNRIEDWIDTNSSVTGTGAEDFDYLGLDRPYRAANQMMHDPSELRLILGMEEETYALLEPMVSTILDPAVTINLNTAPAGVIQSVVPGLSMSEAELIVADRDAGVPFNSLNDFTGNPALGTAATGVITDGLGVQSSFFRVSVRAQLQDRFGYLTSVIQRDATDGTIRVIYRDLSKKIQPFIVVPGT